MSKLPYEMIAPQAEALLDKAAIALTNGAPVEEVIAIRTEFRNFLEASGWTVQEFDKEMLARIDASWEEPKTEN